MFRIITVAYICSSCSVCGLKQQQKEVVGVISDALMQVRHAVYVLMQLADNVKELAVSVSTHVATIFHKLYARSTCLFT